MLYNFPMKENYNLHRMIFDLRNSESLRREFMNDKEAFMDRYKLNSDEKRLLLIGDPVEMYNNGVFPYLLHYYWTVIMNGERTETGPLIIYKKGD